MILAEISDEQYKKATEWLGEHSKVCDWASGDRYAGAIGGTTSWIITVTSISQLISINCTCGARMLVDGEDL